MINRRSFGATAFALIATFETGLCAVPSAQTQAAASTQTSGQRRIVVQGVPNLRDLGGYPTADGRHVRWKKIYRSGELSRLTEADYSIIAGLGISVVCDFRRDSERHNAPTKWQGSNPPTILDLPGAQGERSGGGRGAQQPPAPPGLSTLLVNSYPTYPTALASSYRTTIEQLMTKDGAVLYHCTAGKDRTGTFSAMLLTMLGVPREVVMEDYLLTNQYLATPERIEPSVARGASRE
jgi:protein-tyrosine phosphatase